MHSNLDIIKAYFVQVKKFKSQIYIVKITLYNILEIIKLHRLKI